MMFNVQHSICLSRKSAEISLLFLFNKYFIKHWVTFYLKAFTGGSLENSPDKFKSVR